MPNNSEIISNVTIDEKVRLQLGALLDTMIPPNDYLGVPGAGDNEIVLQVVRSLRAASLQRIADALEELDQSTVGELNRTFSELPQHEREEWFGKHDLARHELVRIVGSVTLQCYYCDSRVLESLGVEPRPPFPKGFEVQQGDLSLLEPVRKRGPIYRDPG
ncbi:MAG: hypothetical protein OXG24_05730 [Gammaproteobacteria bacterium]|nr:hypothetical protein [Gammaproteobacteria bacterium]